MLFQQDWVFRKVFFDFWTKYIWHKSFRKKKLFFFHLQSFDLNDKILLILFQANFAYGQKPNRENRAFLFCLFQSTKMKEAKNKQTRSEVSFLFVKTTILLCKTMKHFFVSQLSKIKKPLTIAFGWKKKQLFFLA